MVHDDEKHEAKHDDERRDDVHWIDFRQNEVQDDAYTPAKENVRGPYLPDQADEVNRAAEDDAFNTEGETGLAAGGGTYGAVGAGTSGGTMGRGDTGHFGTMSGTDLSDTLGGPGGPDRTAGPPGTQPITDGPPQRTTDDQSAAE
jgi:hypothetical protein